MGHIEETFAEMKLKPENDMNGCMLTVEKAENFHVHWRNYRLVFDEEEFSKFMQAMKCAYDNWEADGKPSADKNHPVDQPPKYYFQSQIQSNRHEPAKNEEYRKAMVELQQYVPWAKRDDFMHVHYKDLRIDLTVDEFVQFASVVEDAKHHLHRYLRNKSGETEEVERLLEVSTEIHRENRKLAMVFDAEVDAGVLESNWNSMYRKEQIREMNSFKKLKNNIEQHGLKRPLRYALTIVGDNVFGSLLDGHHRVLACRDLGWSKVMAQFEVWFNIDSVKDIDYIRHCLKCVFGNDDMVRKAFEQNKIKLNSLEDAIW